MALPGYRDGQPYLHSHMLAVLPEYRNAGLGRRLKLAQRDDAIARGFDLMEWTFDPLEIKNAHLNIARLGAIVRRYQPDFYGPSSSPLQGGCRPTGCMRSGGCAQPRVTSMLGGEAQTSGNPRTRHRPARHLRLEAGRPATRAGAKPCRPATGTRLKAAFQPRAGRRRLRTRRGRRRLLSSWSTGVQTPSK